MTYVCGKCGQSLQGDIPHELICPLKEQEKTMPKLEGKIADSVILGQLLDELKEITGITSELIGNLNELYASAQKLQNHMLDLRILALEQEKDDRA